MSSVHEPPHHEADLLWVWWYSLFPHDYLGLLLSPSSEPLVLQHPGLIFFDIVGDRFCYLFYLELKD